MSMRAIKTFIDKHMDGRSEVALAILEKVVSEKLEVKKGGQPKVNPQSEYFWYMAIWDLNHRKKPNKMTVENALDTLLPVREYVQQNIKPDYWNGKSVMINRGRYYIWKKENKHRLTLENSATRANLEHIGDEINRLMTEMEAEKLKKRASRKN